MNVATLLAASALRVPTRDAWRHGDRSASYALARDRIARLAGGLQALGLRTGDRVALVLPNGPDLFELLWATFWAGLVTVPVNRHLHPREVAFVLAHSGAKLVVVAPETDDAASSDTTDATVLRTGSPAYEALTAGQPVPVAEVRPEDAAWIFYTSGTTGRPKGATLTHRNLVSMTLNYYADVDPVHDDAVFLHAAPLTHGSGMYLLPAVGHGAVNVISAAGSFDPADYLALAQADQVTHGAFLAPTMLRRLTDEVRAGSAPELPQLRSLVIGGAALYQEDLQEALDAFGPIITQMYGQGEAPMTIAVMKPDQVPHDHAHPRRRSCGRPFTGVEVRVADADGAELPAGTTGEIRVRGDVVMTGYWSDPAATAGTIDRGWLRTGDVGHVDELGFLYLTDRSKDVIISGGSNIYPREVEEVLLTHPAVHEAAVVGIPDPEWGENVGAFVVTGPGTDVTEAELIAHSRAHLASFKKPKSITFLNELPKNANGKILKRALSNPRSGEGL
ncbi:class I adenylate-forming enzyme family protein [Amycolatopsis australiensis]|uniref:Acyl-CoA synthetase (AMP-forming)/AMP-acid ligase II n=1 Tax=Amycolatopsis australiensis TaxID=546364 RepID=A0A1K1SAI6_9PSEU|nr:AMP-binding protein [Amycolatopsis australiensis]SFW81371.1 Acyl-CoA synthetase (AMP-forming)/AMP-acid ligase II [Amycolatopsis australiensis]